MKTTIISLGGSIIFPNKIDIKFLKDFKRLIESFVKKGRRFVIICGGGSVARKYQQAISKIIGNDTESLDWMGISITHVNAFLMGILLQDYSDENIIINPKKNITSKKRVLVAGGWKPGCSTDYDAVLLAKNLKAGTVINITNVDYVYDKNPKLKGAKKIKETTWKEIRKIVGNKWSPGLNMPFDPIAAKLSEKLKLKVIVTGKNLNNLKRVLENKKFKGTLIR
ncbi:MAG: UMP kinase [Nanoarchaeota archaeon]|nr:UMP kinase [Nanoarchaeota archaeon]